MTTDSPALHKVTAFVTRGTGETRELLVFRHPSAGVQLPAGSVEDGERPEDAVLREVREETGLPNVEIARPLAMEEALVPPTQRWVRRVTPLFTAPDPNAEPCGIAGRSGFWLDVREVRNGYREVTQCEYEWNCSEFLPVGSKVGWVLDDDLTNRIVRSHFEIHSLSDTRDRWFHFAEEEHNFELYWVPIRKDPGLAGVQDGWRRLVLPVLAS